MKKRRKNNFNPNRFSDGPPNRKKMKGEYKRKKNRRDWTNDEDGFDEFESPRK